jgi:hypothetical protein
MSLLYEINSSDMYGLNNGKLVDPILYMLYKTKEQTVPKQTNEVINEIVKYDNSLDKEIKSKYNLLKDNEPQSIGGFSFGFIPPKRNIKELTNRKELYHPQMMNQLATKKQFKFVR